MVISSDVLLAILCFEIRHFYGASLTADFEAKLDLRVLLVSSTEDFWCGIVFRINVSISNNVLKLCFHWVNRESLCASFACSRESSSCNENCVLPSKKWNFSTEFRILEKPILVWNAFILQF